MHGGSGDSIGKDVLDTCRFEPNSFVTVDDHRTESRSNIVPKPKQFQL